MAKNSAVTSVSVGIDGAVSLDGQTIGHVFGEPRNWSFMLTDLRESRRTPSTGWHSKREAAGMCADAWRETRGAA